MIPNESDMLNANIRIHELERERESLTARLAEVEALVKEAREHDSDVYWLSREWHKRAANGGQDE